MAAFYSDLFDQLYQNIISAPKSVPAQKLDGADFKMPASKEPAILPVSFDERFDDEFDPMDTGPHSYEL